jgi:hypothetical protein
MMTRLSTVLVALLMTLALPCVAADVWTPLWNFETNG